MLASAASILGPHGRKLRKNPVAELIAAARKGERRVRVQTLEAAGTRRAADSNREFGSQRPLLPLGIRQAASEPAVAARSLRPALHAAGRLQSGDRGDEEGTRQPERRRERLAAVVERRLLRDRGTTERAARDDPPKGARRASQLPLDCRAVIHRGRG